MASQPKTMRDLSVVELIDGAERELKGFTDFIEKVATYSDEDARWMRAFDTSIRVRLAVARMKVEAVINAKAPTISLSGASQHD